MNKLNVFYRSIFYIYGLGWLIGGLIYAYANIIAPVLYSPHIVYTPSVATEFLLKLHPGWTAYVVAFIFFTIADTAMMVTGVVFRNFFGINVYTNTAVFCLFAGGLIGVLVDLHLLSCWLILGSLNLSPEILQGFWSTFVVQQYIGIILSAWGFFIGGAGIYAIYLASKPISGLKNSWKKMTLFIFWLCVFSVLSIIYALVSYNGVPAGIIFFIFTVIAIPIWSLWFIKQFNQSHNE